MGGGAGREARGAKKGDQSGHINIDFLYQKILTHVYLTHTKPPKQWTYLKDYDKLTGDIPQTPGRCARTITTWIPDDL